MTAKSTTIVQIMPAILRRDNAAAYMGISVSMFEAEVRKKRFPAARKIGDGASGWLRSELDACALALPVSDLAPGPGRRQTQGAPTAA